MVKSAKRMINDHVQRKKFGVENSKIYKLQSCSLRSLMAKLSRFLNDHITFYCSDYMNKLNVNVT